jgi:hypothetical protein
MKVNNEPADPGCYVAGHWGQYGLDRLADVCEGFDIAVTDANDPRYWRRLHDEGDNQHDVEQAWESLVHAADRLEELLNDHTTGGYWSWEDGEFFLVQTEVERLAYVPVDDGMDYDDAWARLVEDPGWLVMSYDDLETGQRAYTFRTIIHYEREE